MSSVMARGAAVVQGLDVLDAFGHDPQPESVGEVDRGSDDRCISDVRGHLADKSVIDFEFLQGRIAERGQRVEPRAVVIDGQRHAAGRRTVRFDGCRYKYLMIRNRVGDET